MDSIAIIKTVNGLQRIRGERIGMHHLVHASDADTWVVTHLPSGYLIARFATKKEAVALATVLKNTKCDWDFEDINVPKETRVVILEIYSALCEFLRFITD